MNIPVVRLLGTLQGRFQLAAGSVLCVGFAMGSALTIGVVRQELFHQHHRHATTVVNYVASCIDRKAATSEASIGVARQQLLQGCVDKYASQSLIIWIRDSSGSGVLPRQVPVVKALLPYASIPHPAHHGGEHGLHLEESYRIAHVGQSVYLIHLHQSKERLQFWTAEDITGTASEGVHIAVAMAWLWAAAALISIIVMHVLSRKISGPLNRLVASVDALDAKSIAFEPLQVGKGSPLEITQLAEAFDHLLTRLKESLEHQKQFSNGVSHELRTPLTIMAGYLSRLSRDSANLTDRQARAVRALQDEVTRMTEMTSDLLDLARADGGRLEVELEKVCCVELLQNLFKECQSVYPGRLTLAVPEHKVCVMANRSRLRQILLGLLDNAVKFTPESGLIKVGLSEMTDGRVRVFVSDTGCGIPRDEILTVQERFKRGSNSTGVSGTGLGLSIASVLAKAMNSSLSIESEFGQGTEVSLVFVRCDSD